MFTFKPARPHKDHKDHKATSHIFPHFPTIFPPFSTISHPRGWQRPQRPRNPRIPKFRCPGLACWSCQGCSNSREFSKRKSQTMSFTENQSHRIFRSGTLTWTSLSDISMISHDLYWSLLVYVSFKIIHIWVFWVWCVYMFDFIMFVASPCPYSCQSVQHYLRLLLRSSANAKVYSKSVLTEVTTYL